MISRNILWVCICLFTGALTRIQAQAPVTNPVRIAVLDPLYIDSAFNGYDYKLEDNSMPQYILAGLDFYNGVMLAADSLQKEGANLEIWVYDTKKKNQTIDSILTGMQYLNFSLILASFTNPLEQKAVSAFSAANNIPLISVTYPNNAGIESNPFFVILNSTLQTHVTGIYQYMQQNYANANPLFIARKGGYLEQRISGWFKAAALPGNSLNYRYTELGDDFSPGDVLSQLDSTRQNIIVCGTLNENFGLKLVKTISDAKSYKATIVGMPDWDALPFPDDPDIDIIYSTPFNYPRTDSMEILLNSEYYDRFFARPSDMVFKGFEAMYHFTHLLTLHPGDFINHVADTSFTVCNNFDIRPVQEGSSAYLPSYLENKTLYFVKKNNGVIVSITRLHK